MCILASRMVHLRFVPFLFASWSFACALGSVDIFRRSDATGISVSTTSAATSTLTLTPTETLQTDVKGPVSLPPIGSYPRDFSPAGLQRLWSFVSLTLSCHFQHSCHSDRVRYPTSVDDHSNTFNAHTSPYATPGPVPVLVCTYPHGYIPKLEIPQGLQVWGCYCGVSSGRCSEIRWQGTNYVGLGTKSGQVFTASRSAIVYITEISLFYSYVGAVDDGTNGIPTVMHGSGFD